MAISLFVKPLSLKEIYVLSGRLLSNIFSIKILPSIIIIESIAKPPANIHSTTVMDSLF